VVGHSGLKDGASVRAVNALAPIPQAPEDSAAKSLTTPPVATSAPVPPGKL